MPNMALYQYPFNKTTSENNKPFFTHTNGTYPTYLN